MPVLAALLVLGCAAGTLAGTSPSGYPAPALGLAQAALGMLVLWRGRGGRVSLAVCGIAVLIGGALAARADARLAPIADLLDFPLGSSAALWIGGTVSREPVDGPGGSRFVLRAERVRRHDGWEPTHGFVEVRMASPAPAPNWLPGTELELHTALHADRPAANPGTPRRDRLRGRGLDLRGTLKHHSQARVRAPPEEGVLAVPARLRATIRTAISTHEQRALLRALLLGERDDISDRTWQSLDRAGILHLLAISGLHVGILVSTAQVGLRAAGASPWVARLGAVGACALALCLVEPRAPVRRASLSVGCYLIARLTGAQATALDCLAAATVLQLIRAPGDVLDLGFQLTSVASLGLVLSLDSTTTGTLPALVRASATAQLWVAPLVAMAAAKVPVAAMLVNLVAVPALAVALPVALASVVASGVSAAFDTAPGIAAMAAVLAWATDGLLGLMIDLARVSGDALPTVAVPAAGWLGAGVYWSGLTLAAAGNTRRRMAGVGVAGAAAIGAALPMPAPVVPQLIAFDVGQGDALLLRAGPDAVMYDTGGFPGLDYDVGYHVLSPQLRRAGLHRLEALAISHFHADHSGGVPGVVRSVAVRELWTGSTPPAARDHVAALAAAAASGTAALTPITTRRVGACTWSPLLPDERDLLAGTRRVSNRASLVMLAGCGRHGVLFAGDADVDAEAGWLGRLRNTPFATRILKLGHHGSDTSTSAALLDALRPHHALISVGARNPWGLPRDSVLDRLRSRAVAVYRTDRDGAVTMHLGDRVRVRAERWIRPRY